MNTATTQPSAIDETRRLEIEQWLIRTVAGILELEPAAIDPRRTFDSYGLDSSASIGLTAELGHWLNRGLDPTLLYDHQTIDEVARRLAAKG